jgi:hypothetical protein
MKRMLLLFSLVLAVGVTAPVAAAARPLAAAHLSGTQQFVVGWCCGEIWDISGHGVLQGIGAVDFDAQYLTGVDPFLTFDPEQGYIRPYGEERQLQLTLTAPNGDALVLAGSTTWSDADPAPPLTWAVVSGTGRFAHLTGSGTYEVALGGSTATLTLGGSLG